MSKVQAGNTLISQYVPPFVVDGSFRDDDILIWKSGLNAFVNTSLSALGIGSDSETANIIYVSKSGRDFNNGRSLTSSVLTIKRGLEVLKEFIEEQGGGRTEPGSPVAVLKIFPGIYVENGDLEIPPNCGVVSDGGQYTTEVHASPGNEEKNMFLVDSGSYVQGFTFRNQRVDDFEDPSGGFAIAFKPGARIIRSPYIRDCGQVSNYDGQQITAPLDPENANPLVGRGGGVLLADRAILDVNSIFPYMLAFGATPRSPNGLGYVAKNGAGINGISSISIFQRAAFYALNGGQITLNNSGTQFGDISMRAKGFIPVVEAVSVDEQILIPTGDETASAVIRNAPIIDGMWEDLLQNYPDANPNIPGTGWTEKQEFQTRRDAANLIAALGLDVLAGTQVASQSFALGFFTYDAQLAFPQIQIPAFFHTWDYIVTQLGIRLGVNSAATIMIEGLIAMMKQTVQSPNRLNFGSLIESLGHQFNNAGSGVNQNALPLNFRRPGSNRPVPFSVLQEGGGRVRWSGADEINNQYFAGGTKINGITGKFEGRPFDISVRQIARRLANSRGNF